MINQLNENIIPILLLVIMALVATILISLFIFILPMKNRINEMSRIMFFLLKKDEKYNNSHDSIKHALQIINDNIGSLSSSTSQSFEKLVALTKQTNSITILPTPEKAKMMRETILENINMEVLLSKNMRIQNPKSIIHIAENTIKTYPDIDVEFTAKLCLAMIENYMLTIDDQTKENQ